jgi:hypothetical protein
MDISIIIPQEEEEQSSLTLTSQALRLKDQAENNLLLERKTLWMQHAHIFIALARECREILKERDFVLNEFIKAEDDIHHLQTTLKYNDEMEQQNRIYTWFKTRMMQKWSSNNNINNMNDDTITQPPQQQPQPIMEFDIGIARLNKEDLGRYLLELKQRYISMKSKYKFLHSQIFDKTDALLEFMLGKSLVNGCVMLQT